METTTYTVEYSATRSDGERIMNVRHVDLIDGYTTFADIPAIIGASTGHKEIVIISAKLKS